MGFTAIATVARDLSKLLTDVTELSESRRHVVDTSSWRRLVGSDPVRDRRANGPVVESIWVSDVVAPYRSSPVNVHVRPASSRRTPHTEIRASGVDPERLTATRRTTGVAAKGVRVDSR